MIIGASVRRGAAVLLFAAVAAASAVAAERFEDGLAAYKSEDYQAALGIFRPLAEGGDAGAQAYLGAMYRLGQGVAQDNAESGRWLLMAAEQGHAEAQYSLATMYVKGWIDPKSTGDAAAALTAEEAKSLDAAVFWYRSGTPAGHAEAAKWFHRAAERGLVVAQYRLGTMYMGGLAVRQDPVEAYKWLTIAAAAVPEGQGRDGLLQARGLVESEMTPDEIAEGARRAEAWKAETD